MLVQITNQKLIREALDRLKWFREETRTNYFSKNLPLEIDDFLYFKRDPYGIPVYSRNLGLICIKAWQKKWHPGYRMMKELVIIQNLPTLLVPFVDVQKRIAAASREATSKKDQRVSYRDNAWVRVLEFNKIALEMFWQNYLDLWYDVVEAYRKKR